MKALVFVFVLANLLFYAFSTGLIGAADVGDGVRLTQQVLPERIHIVARGEPPAPAVVPATVAEPAPATAGEDEAPAATAVPAQQACLLWPRLSLAEAERVSRVLGGGFTDFTALRLATGGDGSGWWVHIPPLTNKASAEKKAQELKALAVSDYFIVQDGPVRHAISLGIFSSEKSGKERLAELQAQGVRSARLGIRPDKEGNLRLELRGPAERLELLQTALAEALPQSSPENCK